MKGQLTVEYLISFLVFIGLIAYIYLSYSANIPSFMQEVKKEDIRSKAIQLSEVLINNLGEPPNWNSTSLNSDIKRIGLLDHNSNKQNLISRDKVNKLDSDFNCNINYEELQKKLAMNKTFSLIISRIDDDGDRTPLYTCTPPFVTGMINVTIVRVVALNDSGILNTTEVIIQM